MTILFNTKSLTCAELRAIEVWSSDLERRATTCLLNSWSSRCNKSNIKPRSNFERMLCIQLARRSGSFQLMCWGRKSVLYPPLLRGRISACCLTSFFLNAWLDLAAFFAEAPLNKHSWNRSRAPARLVAKEAETNNCSQNCVFGPLLGGRILCPKMGTLAAHVNKPGPKTGTKNAPKSKPWKSTTLRAMFEKESATQAATTVPICAPSLCWKGVLWWFHAARCLTRLEQGLSCLLLAHTQKRRILWQNIQRAHKTGPNCDPKTRFAIWSTRQCEATKPFWKTTRRWAPAYAPCPESGLGAHAVIENPIYCGRMTMTMLALIPWCIVQNATPES